MTNDPKKATALRDLRRWHLGGAAATPLPTRALPALLAPFRDSSRVRHDYPLVIEHAAEGLRARPLGELLPEWVERATGERRLLQDNVRRLERQVRLELTDGPDGDARQILQAAGEGLIAELQLGEEVAARVRADLGAMLAEHADLELLPLHGSTALRLLTSAASRSVTAARERLDARIRKLTESLRQLIASEEARRHGPDDGAAMQRSLGGAATRFLDSAALARSVGSTPRGTPPTDPERLQRLQRLLATLEGHGKEAMPEVVLLDREQSEDVCAAAIARFDRSTAALLPVVQAAYAADLELRSAYEAERHDALLDALGWQDFSPDELHALPVVVALVPARDLAGHELQSLTGLLTSGRPVQVLVPDSPAHDPLAANASRSRLELAYLGIAFRDVYVQQSTAARPAHLLRGFEKALGGTRPGLHVVDSGLDPAGQEPALGAFLHAGAAIEGRAHPLLQYDPDAGDTWAKRLDFSLNPAPDADWPRSEARAPTGGESRREYAFTFADYAVLEPHLRDGFTLVQDAVGDSRELVEIADYLQLAEEDARHRIPFVWIALGDTDDPFARAAVRRQLADACRDRLRFWRTLQELAGVRNEHVREAVQRARQEAAEQAAREREELVLRHREELEQARNQAIATAMQGLAHKLLELEPPAGAAVLMPRATDTAAPVAEPAASANAAPAPTAEAEQAPGSNGHEEPWIESARCSTCNDCIDINSLLFVYDENKQARIGDPRAGTYKQLVQAAEKCPSRCIHPGKPLNPDEPGLEALIKRAVKYD